MGKTSVALFMGVLVASFFSWGRITGPQLKMPIEQALVEAPLWSLAGTTHIETDALVERFKAHGIAAKRDESIRELSSKHRVAETRLLAIVFLPE